MRQHSSVSNATVCLLIPRRKAQHLEQSAALSQVFKVEVPLQASDLEGLCNNMIIKGRILCLGWLHILHKITLGPPDRKSFIGITTNKGAENMQVNEDIIFGLCASSFSWVSRALSPCQFYLE
jgi:hypothetical protein